MLNRPFASCESGNVRVCVCVCLSVCLFVCWLVYVICLRSMFSPPCGVCANAGEAMLRSLSSRSVCFCQFWMLCMEYLFSDIVSSRGVMASNPQARSRLTTQVVHVNSRSDALARDDTHSAQSKRTARPNFPMNPRSTHSQVKSQT